jgi:hypothetical protein
VSAATEFYPIIASSDASGTVTLHRAP